jgi:cytidine deaminase
MNITNQELTMLIERAINARKNAYCPYSHYAVGAAILTHDNTILTGTNIEVSALRLGCCAEQLVLLNARAQGYGQLKALVIVTDDGQTPCGTCRQLLYELYGDVTVIIAKTDATHVASSTLKLLPTPFKKEPCCK